MSNMLTRKCHRTLSDFHLLVGSFLLAAAARAYSYGDTIPDFNWERLSIICTNMATGVQCDTMDIRSLNFGGFTDTHRNIISVDIDGYYALGFQQITRGEFFLSIYPFYPTDDSAGPAIWTANRNWPVDENGTLGFLSTGTLELRDSRGTVVRICTPVPLPCIAIVLRPLRMSVTLHEIWDRKNPRAAPVNQSFD